MRQATRSFFVNMLGAIVVIGWSVSAYGQVSCSIQCPNGTERWFPDCSNGRVPANACGSSSGGETTDGTGNTTASGRWLACKIWGRDCPDRSAEGLDLNLKGNAAFQRGDYASAVSFYEKSLRLLPQDAVIRDNLARARAALVRQRAVQTNEKGNQALAKGDYSAAASLYERALKDLPGDAVIAQNLRNVRDALARQTADSLAAKQQAEAAKKLAAQRASVKGYFTKDSVKLVPLNDGGRPIDLMPNPQSGPHGLVGGTTWTYGFQMREAKCDRQCKAELDTKLAAQLADYCAKQTLTNVCINEGLPFTPELYDTVVSMAASNSAIVDLATRVIFDGAMYGEYTRQHNEQFAGLKGKKFGTLDCHSNGAMLCLAALRSGDTAAKEVRLFGPQINPEAARLWQEYALRTKTVIKIYINTGDPITPASWRQPVARSYEQTPTSRTAVWLDTAVRLPYFASDAAFYSALDSRKAIMDGELGKYGLYVIRSACKDHPSLDCHSMKLYEANLR